MARKKKAEILDQAAPDAGAQAGELQADAGGIAPGIPPIAGLAPGGISFIPPFAGLPPDLVNLPRLDELPDAGAQAGELPPDAGAQAGELPPDAGAQAGELPPDAPVPDKLQAPRELITDLQLGAIVAEAIAAVVAVRLHGLAMGADLRGLQQLAARCIVQLADARDTLGLTDADLPQLRQLLLRSGAGAPDLSVAAVELAAVSAVQLRSLAQLLQS